MPDGGWPHVKWRGRLRHAARRRDCWSSDLRRTPVARRRRHPADPDEPVLQRIEQRERPGGSAPRSATPDSANSSHRQFPAMGSGDSIWRSWTAASADLREIATLLNVRNLAVNERDLQILVHVYLPGS